MIPYHIPRANGYADGTYEELLLPEKIYDRIAKENCRADQIGMSGASVLFFGDKVLKVQEHNEEAENEFRMMQYLRGKLPVNVIKLS